MMDMNIKFLDLTITSFKEYGPDHVTVNGRFDEFLGDSSTFTAVYDPSKDKISSFNITPYDERDYAIMANNVFHQLCLIDEGREPGWHDIRQLAENVKAYDNRSDVAYIAEAVLVEMQYIERDPRTINVRLTALGRQNCARGIDIPPSDIQKLRRLLESVHISERLDVKKISNSAR